MATRHVGCRPVSMHVARAPFECGRRRAAGARDEGRCLPARACNDIDVGTGTDFADGVQRWRCVDLAAMRSMRASRGRWGRSSSSMSVTMLRVTA
ncbi:hypothetical protein AQ810_02190 [Burkholderia pseudomallei]|nr:hypothetical protein AQ810_02190 [Burkholderia pseudomallei]